MKIYNIGMLGSGEIAKKIGDVVNKNSRLKIYAVASRNKIHAEKFAMIYNIPYPYDSYEEMLKNDDIDIVYVSTPTICHYKHVKQCLLANKNVICEKPFVENENQAKELFAIAKEKKLLLLDGLWSIYMPIMKYLSENVKSIGDVKFATASLGYPCFISDGNGVSKPKYALWDLEVYPLATMLILLGEPVRCTSKSRANGLYNTKNKAYLYYPHGKGRICADLKHRTNYTLALAGKKGIIISFKWWLGRYPVIVWRYPFKITVEKFTHAINGYEYEINEAVTCLDNKVRESYIYDQEKTVSLMKWIDKLNSLDK